MRPTSNLIARLFPYKLDNSLADSELSSVFLMKFRFEIQIDRVLGQCPTIWFHEKLKYFNIYIRAQLCIERERVKKKVNKPGNTFDKNTCHNIAYYYTSNFSIDLEVHLPVLRTEDGELYVYSIRIAACVLLCETSSASYHRMRIG